MKDATSKNPNLAAEPPHAESWHTESPHAERTGAWSAVLRWSGLLTAVALVAVPLWMLLGNSAVLGGHPALPVLLLAAVALGLLWMVLLATRTSRKKPRKAADGPQPHRTESRWHLVRGIAIRLAALGLVAALAWLNPFAHQPSGATGQTTVTTTEDATSITLAPEGKASTGLIFYPGARVDARAYQDILGPLANAGHLVVILKVPLGISLLDSSQARGIMAAHPEITSWAVGGHSLGGVSASSFAKSNADVSGLLLFASYPVDSMAGSTGLSVLSISGSNDGLSNPDKIAASKPLLPPATRFVTVEGGVHAFFGDYGEQPGDGTPGISRDEARRQITAESLQFLDQLRPRG